MSKKDELQQAAEKMISDLSAGKKIYDEMAAIAIRAEIITAEEAELKWKQSVSNVIAKEIDAFLQERES